MINEKNNIRMKISDFFEKKGIIHLLLTSMVALTIILYIFPIEFDLTRNSSNSISSNSRSILKSLDVDDDEMEIIYFSAITNTEVDINVQNRIKTIFEQFKKYNKNIKYEIIDLSKNVEALNKYPMADTKTVLISYNDKNVSIPFESFTYEDDNLLEIHLESVLIDELIKLKDIENYYIYYTNSHNEKIENDEYSDFNVLLKNLGYETKKIDLNEPIPSNVSTLYVIAPKQDFSEEEINRLRNYVASGNSLLISLATSSNDNKSLVSYPNLKSFCHELGINIIDEIIVDQIQDKKLIGVYSSEDEEAVRLEKVNPIIYMPSSRMMNINENDNNGYEITKTMVSGELASYPLIVKLEKENSKVLILATPEIFSNSYITNNKVFSTYLIKWVDNFKTNTNIKPFTYRTYSADAAELKPAIVLGVIEIMIPLLALYVGYEISRKRIMNTKSKTMK